MLGSGKTDYATARRLAMERVSGCGLARSVLTRAFAGIGVGVGSALRAPRARRGGE